MSQITIKSISAESTLKIRQRILRPGQNLENCVFPGDEFSSSYHVGGFVDGRLVSIASVLQQQEERFNLFESDAQFRLRGMATEEEYRGQGLGTAVVAHCLEKCWNLGGNVFWCNARITAVGFYERMGFTTHDQEFDLPGVGIHRVMYVLMECEGRNLKGT
jgi:GNAT superfamily N-acetyltransferase